MMFDSGAGVEVIENRGHLTARVFLPWHFIVRVSNDFYNINCYLTTFSYFRTKPEGFSVIGVLT